LIAVLHALVGPTQYIFAVCTVSDIGNGETAYFPMAGLDCGTEFRNPTDLLLVRSDERHVVPVQKKHSFNGCRLRKPEL
jgi:hypothetical protein